MNIICFSNIDWDFIKQRHQQLMLEFDRREEIDKIIFVETFGTRCIRLNKEDMNRGKQKLNKLLNNKDSKIKENKYNKITIISPKYIPLFNKLSLYINKKNFTLDFEKIIKEENINLKDTIVWIFMPHPVVLNIINKFYFKLIIYDCIDDIKSFKDINPKIVKTEEMLIRQANIVFCTSKMLLQKCNILNDNVYMLKNAVSSDLFNKHPLAACLQSKIEEDYCNKEIHKNQYCNREINKEDCFNKEIHKNQYCNREINKEDCFNKEIHKNQYCNREINKEEYFNKRNIENQYCNSKITKTIGYIGTLYEWFDLDLIDSLSKQYKDIQIVLAGPVRIDLKILKGRDNVKILGKVPYEEVAGLIDSFDVCLIPFIKSKLILNTNPVKLYEYFSKGKPVVAINIPELEEYKDIMYIYNTKSEFLDCAGRALLENDSLLIKKRTEVAYFNTWESRVDDALKIINNSNTNVYEVDANGNEANNGGLCGL